MCLSHSEPQPYTNTFLTTYKLHIFHITNGPFVPVPYRIYLGHTLDLIDVSWSKGHFM